MKTVALILALTVITGCNARAVLPDATLKSWEDTVDRFWQYVDELNQKADGVVQELKASQLTRELDTLISDSMAELAVYRDDIQTKLTPYTDSSTGQLAQDMQLLGNKLQKDMLDAKERSVEYLGELKTMMEQNTDDVRSRISTYTHKLKKRLNKDTEEIRNTVATYVGELQSRTSQNIGAVKENVEPYVQQATDTASQKLSDISTILKTQADNLGLQLETQAEGIKTQLEATAQELRTSLEGKIDQLTDMISPFATQIREQIENIMEKVKETAATAA
ncbi:apolipoprotein Eb [Perca fluviatilis]|nr:apolipoprotein Eb [Perca fluviatilis]XP_039662543.1 apolipoprotein Eb [Perca fluviatilis]